MLLNEAIIQFLRYLELEKNYNSITVLNYDHHLRYFYQWAGNFQVSKITLDLILKYREFLNTWKNTYSSNKIIKKSTREVKIKVIKRFLEFLNRKKIKSLHPKEIEIFSEKPERLVYLNQDELIKLLEAPNTNCLMGLRDRAIIEIFFSTGLRLQELVSLNRMDINLKEKEFSVKGKGGKIRTVYLSLRATDWLKKYLRKRKDNFPALFTFVKQRNDWTLKQNGRIGKRTVHEIIKKYVNKAGLDNRISSHSLRHTFATHLLKQGANLREVQMFLGHADLKSTQIYTHFTNPELKKAHQKYINF